MGKPKPPDPKETSAAQTGTSVSTAIANAMMGNVNQYTPYGSLTYEQTGSHKFTDPYTGHSYDIPTFTATQQLSPQQQAIQDRNFATQGNLAQLAQNQSSFLLDYLGSGIDTSNLPGLRTSLDRPAQYGADGELLRAAQAFQTQLGGDYSTAFSGDIGGGYDTAFSRNIGGGYNTAFSRNIGNGYNTIFNQKLGPNYSSDFAREIGGSYTNTLGDDYRTTYAGADDFSADRQRYEEALWTRGADDRARAEEALRTRLLNSGIREGSAAWNSEMARLSRQIEDARLATYLAAGDEQARMVNLARDAAIFGNDAITNQFVLQNAASALQAQFASQQQQAANAAEMGLATFNRDTQQAQNAAALGLAQFGRESQIAQNAAALAKAQFGSAQQQAQNAAALSQAQFASQQQQAANQAALAQMAAQNQALYQEAAFQNAAQAQGMQEAYAARSQPINEIIGLMSGSQIQQPNFVNTAMPTIPTTQNAEIINDHYAMQLASTPNLGGFMTGIGSGIGKLIGMSDERTKKDVKRRGEIDGMGLYEFRYKGEPKSQPKHVGLMAQEVKKKKPEAIVPTSGGLMAVDYGKAVPGLMGLK